MCLVVLAWQAHPVYPLIIAANRDEFHGRPASPLAWWPDRPQVVGGRDLQAGGTWLAAARTGRFATVTNYRENLRVQAGERSRGDLVSGFVSGSDTPLEFSRAIDGDRYAGFSLLTATRDSVAYLSNRGDPPRSLDRGLFGLSNASLDTPWPKVLRSKARLESLLAAGTPSTAALFELLADRETAAGRIEDRDVPAELARAVSAPFVVTPQYGTRCSTVVLLDTEGRVEIHERRFAPGGGGTGETRIDFRVA